MKDISATLLKCDHDGEIVKTKNTEMRFCFGEKPLIFEILVKEGKNYDTFITLSYDEVRNFILAQEG